VLHLYVPSLRGALPWWVLAVCLRQLRVCWSQSATSMLRVRTLDAECGDGKFFLSYDPAPGGVSYRDSLSVDYSSQPCANPCIDPKCVKHAACGVVCVCLCLCVRYAWGVVR